MLVFPCPSCGAKLQTGDDMAGKKIRCGSCQSVATVPASSAGSEAITSDPAPPKAKSSTGVTASGQRSGGADKDEDRADRRRRSGSSDAASAVAATGAGMGIGAIIAIVVCVVGCLGGCGVVAVLIALLVPGVQKVREAAARTQTQNNMKQMALAEHQHFDTFKTLPTPKHLKQQNPPQAVELSWRVSILPFIEQDALFRQFDHGQAWNSPRNSAMSNTLLAIYQDVRRMPPQGPPSVATHFQYFTGPNTLWPDNNKRGLIQDIPAGTSNTFLFAEAATPVPWAKPEDIAMRPGQPVPLPTDNFMVSFADGSVRFINRSQAPDAVLLQYIDPRNNGPHPPID
jgi:hypothetical protein